MPIPMDTASVHTQSRYFPDALWQRRTPAEAGIDGARLKAAIEHAIAGEAKNPRDLALNHYQTFGREPFGYAIGPIKERGDQTGLVVHKGYIVAEWGEPARVVPRDVGPPQRAAHREGRGARCVRARLP